MTVAVNVDPFVTAYEEAYRRGDAPALRDHLPPSDHPGYLHVLAELIRVSWNTAGRRPATSHGRLPGRFPQAGPRPDLIEAIAYEEYRQRWRMASQPIHADFQSRHTESIPPAGTSWPAERAADAADDLSPRSVADAA